MTSVATRPATPVRGSVAAARRRRSASKARWWVVVAFMSPFLIGLALFVVYPVFATLYYSFTNYQAGSYLATRWVGFENYRNLFGQSTVFWEAVRNTLWMVAIMVPLQTLWAIFTAWILTRIKRGAVIYRTVFFLPAMVPIVATALAFIVMLNPVGPLNSILGHAGVSGPGWFSDAAWAKPSLVLMALWTVGNTMILFLAAMLDVPAALYEAADIDGANAWQKFRHITLPGISPVIFFSLLTGMIYTFQYFTDPVEQPVDRLPAGFAALLHHRDLPSGLPVLQDRVRVRDGLAAVRGDLPVHGRLHPWLAPLGLLRGGRPMRATVQGPASSGAKSPEWRDISRHSASNAPLDLASQVVGRP